MEIRKGNRTLLLCFMVLMCFILGTNDLISEEKKDVPSPYRKRKQTQLKQGGDSFYSALELTYLTLNTVDLVTTFYSLERGAQEANPIARHFIDNKPLAVAIKGGLTLSVLWGLRQVKKQDKTAAYITLTLLNGLYGFVATNNIRISMQL